MDGFTFVKKVIDRDGFEISTLLSKLGKQENSAVEFKASFLPLPNSNDSIDACSWNVISDIIAMANSSGGCILLGVNDEGEYAEGYLGTLSLDEYKRCLEDYLKEKRSWSLNNKVYTIETEYRDCLLKCIEHGVYDGKLNGKDILIIHIHPTDIKNPIIYKIRKQNEDNDYLTYRDQGAVAKKTTEQLTVKGIINFAFHSVNADYYQELWNTYIGRNNIANSFFIFYTLFVIIQIILIYTDCCFDIKQNGFVLRFLTLLITLPICLIIHSILKNQSQTRSSILANLHYFILSFLISSIFYLLKCFMENIDNIYDDGTFNRLTAGLFIGIMVFWTILIPLLLPKDNKPFKVNPIDIKVNSPHWTWKSVCIDAGFFWNTLETFDYWKLQQHKLTGHCRIFDPFRIRRSYGKQDEIIEIFKDIKTQIKEKL